ncbi:Rrf2 family transcriptional regulator [Endozoicomonadaceae bacterium StTr2]
MQLTRHTDYALRTLIQVALMPEGERLSVAAITETYDLSRSHVMKIVQKLGQQGYLRNIRGKGGGIELGRKPEEINIGEVVRAMESTLQVIDCDNPYCRLQPACKLKHVLADALHAFMAVLDGYTLKDLLENRDELIPLLAL